MLSEETMQELFTNGKTKNKITGFLSKTGKPFDAFLIYEKEEIRFEKKKAFCFAVVILVAANKGGTGGQRRWKICCREIAYRRTVFERLCGNDRVGFLRVTGYVLNEISLFGIL